MINVGGNFVNLGREGMKAKLRLEKFVFMKLSIDNFYILNWL